jgi:hypothetical protein
MAPAGNRGLSPLSVCGPQKSLGLRNFDHAAWATELTLLSASFVKASSVFFSSASV